jgi:hypothetical protein
MKKMFNTLVLLLMSAVIVFYGPITAGATGITSAPIKVVVVSGTNYEMGVQYGEQAAKLIALNRDAVWKLLDEQVLDPNGMLLGRNGVVKDLQVWNYYLEKYDPGLKTWLLGISQGCKNKGINISYMDLMAIMAFPGEIWARPAGDYPVETGVTASAVPMIDKNVKVFAKTRTNALPISSCSAFAATKSATKDGKAMVSITGGAFLEVTNYVILVAFPAEGEQFVTLTYAGRIASNAGMNDKYAWVMPAAVNAPWMPCASSWGVTAEVYFHYLLQYCKTPADAVKYLDSTPKGNVTGLFVFADKNRNVFIYEGGICGSAIRKPGDLGEKDFVVTTNNYNDPSMIEFNLGAEYFPDTFVRYDTVFKKLASARRGSVDLDFVKAVWLSNDWYDAANDTWYTVPVPNDMSDFNICNVPGNLCEGGEYQFIQYPSSNTAYLQLGIPQGTSIQNYWPENPMPTGEYTKWQLHDSIHETACAASDDALRVIETAMTSFVHKANSLDPQIRKTLYSLLKEANIAWWKGRKEEDTLYHNKHYTKSQIARWGSVYTNYAVAQLYAQMVSTKLKQY